MSAPRQDSEELRTVQVLCANLKAIGYNQWQIKRLIRDITGTGEIEKLTKQQLGELAEELRQQYEFALKCITVKPDK
ncbi:MAG: hypothetical protein HPY81_07515 [Firmicutes bacterium]|nr:hypothetical protein [Bacillota bacterium]